MLGPVKPQLLPSLLPAHEKESSMLSNLIVFAVIGLFVGGAARLFYPGRQPMKILGTLVLSMACALLGGLLSWSFWPEVDNQFSAGCC